MIGLATVVTKCYLQYLVFLLLICLYNLVKRLSIGDYLQFLTDNTDFTVVGVIGPPGVGKSTIMNELYGFDGTSPGNIYTFSLTYLCLNLRELQENFTFCLASRKE